MSWRPALAGPWRLLPPVLVQALGAASAFAVAWIISHRFGVESQGRYGLVKGWSDAFATLFMFGLPQALLHLTYHGGEPLAALRGFAERHARRLVMLAIPLAVVASFSSAPWLAWVALATPAFVFHGLLRSLLLRTRGALTYAWLTAAPALLLLAAVGALALLDREAWGTALLVSAVLSALITRLVVHGAGIGREPPAHVRTLSHTSVHAFVQNVLAAAQAALLLSLVSATGGSLESVGRLSFALIFLQLFALAASFLAPMVYDRVARRARTGDAAWTFTAPTATVVGLFALVVVIGIAVLPAFIGWFFPPEYRQTALACQLMGLAGALLLVNRVLATVLQALGAFTELTVLAVLRLVLGLVLTAIAIVGWGWDGALAAAGALALAEVVVGLRLLQVLPATLRRKAVAP